MQLQQKDKKTPAPAGQPLLAQIPAFKGANTTPSVATPGTHQAKSSQQKETP